MNLSPAWVTLLADHGHDALHWRQVGGENASDRDIMAWAARHDRIVLTADRDFGELATKSTLMKTSVVQLRRSSTNPASVGGFVMQEIDAASGPLRSGAVLTIEPGRTRKRLLS